MAKKAVESRSKRPRRAAAAGDGTATNGVLVADIIIKNAPDPVFASDLEGRMPPL